MVGCRGAPSWNVVDGWDSNAILGPSQRRSGVKHAPSSVNVSTTDSAQDMLNGQYRLTLEGSKLMNIDSSASQWLSSLVDHMVIKC